MDKELQILEELALEIEQIQSDYQDITEFSSGANYVLKQLKNSIKRKALRTSS
jgi:hypothetical protein